MRKRGRSHGWQRVCKRGCSRYSWCTAYLGRALCHWDIHGSLSLKCPTQERQTEADQRVTSPLFFFFIFFADSLMLVCLFIFYFIVRCLISSIFGDDECLFFIRG